MIRRHGAPPLSLWLPSRLAPVTGGAFGIYVHPDAAHAARVQAAASFRRAIGFGAPLRPAPFAQAHRQAAMLYLHDRSRDGARLRDIAEQLFDPMPPDWRASSERSDLRRLLDTAKEMIEREYRGLLVSPPPT